MSLVSYRSSTYIRKRIRFSPEDHSNDLRELTCFQDHRIIFKSTEIPLFQHTPYLKYRIRSRFWEFPEVSEYGFRQICHKLHPSAPQITLNWCFWNYTFQWYSKASRLLVFGMMSCMKVKASGDGEAHLIGKEFRLKFCIYSPWWSWVWSGIICISPGFSKKEKKVVREETILNLWVENFWFTGGQTAIWSTASLIPVWPKSQPTYISTDNWLNYGPANSSGRTCSKKHPLNFSSTARIVQKSSTALYLPSLCQRKSKRNPTSSERCIM